jgi:hypothetical protein
LVFGLFFGLVGIGLGELLGVLKNGELAGLVLGLGLGLARTIVHRESYKYTTEIVAVDRLGWSWGKFRTSLSTALVMGWISGGFFGILVGAALGLLAGIFVGTVTGLLFATTIGFLTGQELRNVKPGTQPNQAIYRSGLNAVASMLFFGLPLGLVGGVIVGLNYGLPSGLLSGLIVGLVYGLIPGLARGGRAFVLLISLRYMIWRSEDAPLNYAEFLSYTSERHLTRQGWSRLSTAY